MFAVNGYGLNQETAMARHIDFEGLTQRAYGISRGRLAGSFREWLRLLALMSVVMGLGAGSLPGAERGDGECAGVGDGSDRGGGCRARR